jgi:putative aldouronate transport system substrate-binding protein
MPETLDEFTDYLRWVKNTDLNGNGRNDEIPLAFEGQRHIDNFFAAFAKPFMPFVFTANYVGVALENNRVVEQFKDPRFRDSLRYLAGLYREGLLLPESFNMTQDQLRAISSADTPILAVSGSPWPHHHNILPSKRLFEFFEVRALKGPSGTGYSSNQDPWSILRPNYFVTDRARDPGLAVALYDYFVRFDIMMDSYIGPKGTAWGDAVPGTMSILNLPASHALYVTYGSQALNTTWDQASPMIRNKKFRGGEEATNVPDMVDYIQNRNISLIDSLLTNMSFTNEGFWYLTSYQNLPNAINDSTFIPPLPFSDNDSSRIADINDDR